MKWLHHIINYTKQKIINPFHFSSVFSKTPLYQIILFIYKESKQVDLTMRSSSIAFNLFFSLFPTLILVFTLIPFFQEITLHYLPEESEYYRLIKKEIHIIFPEQIEYNIISFINEIHQKPRFDLISFGFIFTLLFSSNGMMTLIKGFEKPHLVHVFKKRSQLKRRYIAILLTLLLCTLLIFSILTIILGNTIITFIFKFLSFDSSIQYIISLLRWVIVIVLSYIGICVIYRYGPSMYKKTPFFNIGTIFACSLSILSSLVFSFYVNNFGTYDKFYGSIGAIIITMIWLQLNSFILLIGFELNVSIKLNKEYQKNEMKE